MGYSPWDHKELDATEHEHSYNELQPYMCVCVCVCVCKAKWMSLGSSKYIFYESVSKSNTANKNVKAL